MGSLKNSKNIFQYNEKVFFMRPQEISNYYLSYPDELLKRQSELFTKCRYENTFLLKDFNSND